MDTHICPISPPHTSFIQIIYNQIYTVQFPSYPLFPQSYYPPQNSKQYSHFCMHNIHQKLSIYQPLFLFCVDLKPQCMNTPPIIDILLNNILPVILPVIQNPDITLCLYVGFYILPWMLLYHMHISLLNKKQTIKYTQIHTFLKYEIFFLNRNPLKSKQSTFNYFDRLGIVSSTPFPTFPS